MKTKGKYNNPHYTAGIIAVNSLFERKRIFFYAASYCRENFGSVGTDRRPTPSPPQTICPPQLPSCPPQLPSCPPQLPSCPPQPNEEDQVVWRSGHVTELLQQIPVCRSHRILQKYGCSHTRRYYHSWSAVSRDTIGQIWSQISKVYLGSMCTAVLIDWDPPPPPTPSFGLIYEGAIGQPR